LFGILTTHHDSDHTDFSESTEDIKPLTEEEKKAKLAELQEKLKEKKANQILADREEQRRNEVGLLIFLGPIHLTMQIANLRVQQIRMKATKEAQDLKEELKRKEQLRQVAKKREEQVAELEAKRRIKEQIEARAPAQG
jgi:UBX domain-containing protein 1/4